MKKTITLVLLIAITLLLAGCGDSNIAGEAGKGGGGKIKAQCSDGIDNDNDGYCDFLAKNTRCRDGSEPGDVDCGSKEDNKEEADCIPVAERCDGFDNDCDGEIDEGLPIECSSPSDCGTTGWVAQRLGRKWLGIELNPDYIKIAEERFQQQELFE